MLCFSNRDVALLRGPFWEGVNLAGRTLKMKILDAVLINNNKLNPIDLHQQISFFKAGTANLTPSQHRLFKCYITLREA